MVKDLTKYIIVGFFLLVSLAMILPDQEVVYRDRECDCSNQEIKISEQKKDIDKLKKVIELDNEAFALTGEYMGNLEFWLYNPLEAEHALNIYIGKIETIADKKWRIMKEVK